MIRNAIYILIAYLFIVDNIRLYLPDVIGKNLILISTSIYVLYGLFFIRKSPFKLSINEKYLFIFIIGGIFTCFVNSDFDFVLDVLLLTLPLFALRSNLNFSVNFINSLFITQVLIAVVTYHTGSNIYGYLPGQADVTQLSWRVSLFAERTPPYSGFIATLFLLCNIYLNNSKFKYLFITFGLYWALFSGSRTIYLFLFFFTIFQIIPYGKLHKVQKYLPFIGLVFVLVFLSYIENILPVLSRFDFLEFALQNDGSSFDEFDLSRLNLYNILFSLFLDNPFFGVGEVSSHLGYIGSDIGSEVLFISMLASYGVISFFYFTYWVRTLKVKLTLNDRLGYWIVILLVFSFMLYSSFVKPYNYGVVLAFILFLSNIRHKN